METIEINQESQQMVTPSNRMKNICSVPGHADAINFILRMEEGWEFYKTAIIAETDKVIIINGRIFKKEVT